MTAVADGMKQEGLSQASQAFVATLECSGAGKLSIMMVWFASRECGCRLSAKHPCVGCGVLLATSVQSRRREGVRFSSRFPGTDGKVCTLQTCYRICRANHAMRANLGGKVSGECGCVKMDVPPTPEER